MDFSGPRKKQEDEYFAREEFDRRKKAAEEAYEKMKVEEKAKQKELHWMHCPKCGSEMVEIDYEGISLDKCTHCLGIFFDNGELEQLLTSKGGFVRKMLNVFKD